MRGGRAITARLILDKNYFLIERGSSISPFQTISKEADAVETYIQPCKKLPDSPLSKNVDELSMEEENTQN